MHTQLKIIVFIIFCLAGTCTFAIPQSFQDPQTWHDPLIQMLLKRGKILSKTPMKDILLKQGKKVDFDGQVFLVELDNGLKAVFKPVSENDIGDAWAEVAAYRASLKLGFPYIPPTVLYKSGTSAGSLQLYVETGSDALDSSTFKSSLQEANPQDLANLDIFNYIFGQWDTGPHNMLILKKDKKTYLIAIDNSGIRNHQHVEGYGQLPYVRVIYSDRFKTDDWHEPFPFHRAGIIKEPSLINLKKTFGNRLPASFYKNFKYNKNPFVYVIYQNSLWRQFHAFDNDFRKPCSTCCPKQTRKILEKMDIKMIKDIFNIRKGGKPDFLKDNYLKSILKRRDQVLKKTADF